MAVVGALAVVAAASFALRYRHQRLAWSVPLVPFVAYGVGLVQAWRAPGAISWTGTGLVMVALCTYVGLLALLVVWVRRLKIRGGGLLSIAIGFGGALWGTGLVLDSLRHLFQSGLGYTQTPLELSLLDALRLTWIFWAALGMAALITLAVQALFVPLGSTLSDQATQILFASAVTLVLVTALPQVWFTAYEAGASIRAGELTRASGLATCVQVTRDDPLTESATWSDPLVHVGSASGPSILIDPDSDTPITVMPDGVVVRPVARAADSCGKS